MAYIFRALVHIGNIPYATVPKKEHLRFTHRGKFFVVHEEYNKKGVYTTSHLESGAKINGSEATDYITSRDLAISVIDANSEKLNSAIKRALAYKEVAMVNQSNRLRRKFLPAVIAAI